MKKKQFEKLKPQYEGMQASEEQNYMVDAFVKDEILVIDFYKQKRSIWTPLWRTLINEKEFCNFDWHTSCWNQKRPETMMSECSEISIVRRGYGGMEKYYILSEETKRNIEEYIKKIGGSIYGSVETTVYMKIENIASEKRATAYDRKMQRIQKKMQTAPDIPSDFRNFIMNQLYKNDHYLYYSKTDAFCSRCGSSMGKNKDMRHNAISTCPVCEERIRYKSIGRMSEHDERKEVLLIQKNEDDVILRYFKCSLLSTYKSKESLHYSESVRTYHRNRIENYSARYISYTDFLNHTFWTDKMDPWHQVTYGLRSCLYAGNYEEIKELLPEELRWIMPELAEEGVLLPWKDMFRNAQWNSVNGMFEKFYKAGLKKLAVEYAINSYSISINHRNRELKKILGISKPMLRYMQEHDNGKKVLAVFQDACKENCGLNDNEIFELAEAGIKVSELKVLAHKQKIIKLLHYLKKVKGYGNLKSSFQHYEDYVSMALSREYDFENDTVRYPKDLKAAHDKVTREFYENETDKHKCKKIKENPNISAVYQVLSEVYGWKNKDFIIIPPKNAGEIVEEGRTLHHCVGGDNYLRKHNNGTTYILFMRKVEKPDKPYYTLEIDPKDNRILQYYGKNDKKPDKEIVDDFLNKWKRHLNNDGSSSQKLLVG